MHTAHTYMHAHSAHMLCMACEVFEKGVNAYVTCMVGTYTRTYVHTHIPTIP